MKKKIAIAATALTLATANLVAITADVISATSSQSLSYTMVNQAKTNWCWAASAENSARGSYQYRLAATPSRSQWDAVYHIKGNSSNQHPNVAGSISDIEEAAEYIARGKFNWGSSNSKKSFNTLKSQIIEYKTPVVGGSYSSGGGHAITCIGYKINDSGTQYIRIYDPWDGTRAYTKYTDFCNGTGYASLSYRATCWK